MNLVSKYFLKKSTRYYNSILRIVTFSSLLFMFSVFNIINSYTNLSQNFIKNSNLSLIQVIGTNKNEVQPISYDDLDNLRKLNINNSYVFATYKIPFNIQTSDNSTVYISSIPVEMMKLVGEKCNEADVCSMREGEYLYLDLPKIEPFTEILTGNYFTMSFSNINTLDIENVFNTNKLVKSNVFTSNDRLLSILNGIYSVSNTNISQFDNKVANYFDDIYIYIDDIKYLENTIEKYEANGYITSYVLNNFENIIENTSQTNMMLFLFSIVFYLFTIILICILINNYIKLQKKDLGILKLYGYSDKHLLVMLLNNSSKSFVNVGISNLTFIIIFAIFTMEYKIIYIITNIIYSLTFYLVIQVITYLSYKFNINRTDIRGLISGEKEFE